MEKKDKTIIVYADSWCALCRKTSKYIRNNDYFNKIHIEDIRKTKLPDNIDKDKAMHDVACYNIKTNKVSYGYDSVVLIFKYLPLFWVLYPLLFLLKLTGLGQLIYTQVSTKRRIIPVRCNENCEINPNLNL
ncbi:MAG: DCC1-like thiol-disulfide oxidoreductase family protein [Marinifilaceae bacterium]|jgi:predicted DCC family thiol-disulfide oxidoreductase YuxK|nr:DCC1-like thiol-disulfide oxidoreductase family protein [Marinifilaceae bacterium]